MRKHNKSLLQKFIISHMIITTLVFAVTGTFYYLTSTGLTKDETILMGTNILEDGKNTIDDRVDALLNLSIPLITRDNVRIFENAVRPFSTGSHVELNDTMRRLNAYTMMNDFADSLILYYKENGLFIADNSVGVYSEAFYNCWLNHSNMTYQEWRESVSQKNYRRIVSNYGSGNKNMVDIINDLPSLSGSDSVAMIISIDCRTFDKVFEQLEQYNGSYFCITGTDGTLYYSNADEELAKTLVSLPTGNSGGYLVFRARSDVMNADYMALIPQKAVYTREYRFVGSFLFLYLALMLLSFMVFIFLSYKNIKPLKRVMDSIAQNQGIHLGKNDSEAEFIRTAFTDLVYDAENLAVTIRENFLSKILNGSALTIGELRSADTYCGQIFTHDKYQVAVLKIMEFEGVQSPEQYVMVSTLQKIAMERLGAHLSDTVFAHKIDYDKIALIFCLDMDAPDNAPAEMLTQCVAELARIKISVICAVGDSKRLSDQIYMSYQNACWLLQIANISMDSPIYWYTEQSGKSDSFYYPSEAQHRLVNLILAGESEAATDELAKLWDVNFNERTLPEREKGYFDDALRQDLLTLKKTLGELPEESEEQFHYIMTHVRNNADYENNEPYFAMLVGLLANYSSSRKDDRKTTLLEWIYAYVSKHFGDSELGIAALAAHIDMAENYVSTFFKQSTGENLSAYIERVRMDFAVASISEGRMTIKEIAEKSGYSNINTFYKAFKRRYGMPPGKYQQKLDGGKILEIK